MTRFINLLFLIMLSLSGFQFTWAETPATDNFYSLESRHIELDDLIKNSRTSKKGQRFIFKPKLVRFSAVLQQQPKKANADYLINALSMMGMADIPAVSHQMFIRSHNNTVIAVYVEDDLSNMMTENLKVEQELIWHAIHSYNYYRGPALLITSVELVTEVETALKIENKDE